MATPNNDNLTLPPEFSGKAQLILFTRYGDPRDAGWENKWVNDWHIRQSFPWFPQDTIRIHKHFRPLLEEAFTALSANDLHREIKTFDGCYQIRTIGDSNTVLSVHSWGAGIDLNARENPIGSQGVWSDSFINIISNHNIFCGQSWTGRKDPKHFAMVDG